MIFWKKNCRIIKNQNCKKKNLNINWIEKIIFIFFDAISKKQRFDFRFDVDFAMNAFIIDLTKIIINSLMLFVWIKNKKFRNNVKKNRKKRKNWIA